MKTNSKEVNEYVQPGCKIIQVQLQQIIAASGSIEGSIETEEVVW